MEAKEILQGYYSKEAGVGLHQMRNKVFNNRIKAAYLVAEMYDDLIDYPESRLLFGSNPEFTE